MVIVDTSVWVRHFGNRPPYAEGLEELLSRKEVLGHDLVYGELLMGDNGGRRRILTEYRRLKHAYTVSHRDVVTFVESRALYGLGVGWVDIHLLASAVMDQHKLWTADPIFHQLAVFLGVAYS